MVIRARPYQTLQKTVVLKIEAHYILSTLAYQDYVRTLSGLGGPGWVAYLKN